MKVTYSILTSDITNQDEDTFNTWFKLLAILNKRLYPNDFPNKNTRNQLRSKSISIYTEHKRCKSILSYEKDINLSQDRLLTLDILNDLCLFGEILD